MAADDSDRLRADHDTLVGLAELTADLSVERLSYGGERVTAQITGRDAEGLTRHVTTLSFRRART